MANSGPQILTTLRQMILSGEFKANERLAEIPTADRLGVSRTPIRLAFRALEQEGLLNKLPGRGYEVRSVSIAEIEGAVEVRGALEGLAARRAAEKGLTDEQKRRFEELLQQGDELFQSNEPLSEKDIELYHTMNKAFHQLIIDVADNRAISIALSRDEHIPFASVNALAYDKTNMREETKRFLFAHTQHHHIYMTLASRQSARAEMIMREHAHATLGHVHKYHGANENEDIQLISKDPILKQ
ncbi:GntR family transcriptional regulator [Marinomonas balearica]|uniref:GntR family transcriptional regulator n=1 Tax=Marinomonas balearica TaxID=491947 RepID=A0A4R6M6E9_9GAMM|nr:GntR family transcriptional regulator [Marinomonas balearica]TDO96405.1 GntR family transcriptional regulator [Marinomonas balearica]